MAGWIKMRADLLHHEKLIGMAAILRDDPDFRAWACPGTRGKLPLSNEALRDLTCTLLLKVWSCVRERASYDGLNAVLLHLSCSDVDGLAHSYGVANAMRAVGWLDELKDGRKGVIFPNFREYNAPASNAERQAAYRDRHRADPETVTESNVTRVTKCVTRTEKRRGSNNAAAAHCANDLAAAAFDDISQEDFRSPQRMLAWFERHRATLGLQPEEVHQVFAMGVLASDGRAKVGQIPLFRANVQHRRWKYLEPKHLAEAKRMLAIITEVPDGRTPPAPAVGPGIVSDGTSGRGPTSGPSRRDSRSKRNGEAAAGVAD